MAVTKAKQLSYDSTASSLWVDTVQDAIDRVRKTLWVELNSATYSARSWDYVVVKYTWWDVAITLPSPVDWADVRIKKFTGEDVNTISILPNWTELVEWTTWATINLHRTMATFTCIWGDWYVWE